MTVEGEDKEMESVKVVDKHKSELSDKEAADKASQLRAQTSTVEHGLGVQAKEVKIWKSAWNCLWMVFIVPTFVCCGRYA